MSLPITAVGPLNVETNPILIVSAAIAEFASARAVAPASQNAVLIFLSLLVIWCRQSSDLPRPSALHAWFSGLSSSCDVFCARNLGLAASTNRRLPLRTLGSIPPFLHHNSYQP